MRSRHHHIPTNLLASQTEALLPVRGGLPPVRAGFTLIELMVVMVIISILAGLITVASLGFISRARESRTATTISKIDEAIQERVAAINRWHERPFNRLQREWEQRGWITNQYGEPGRWEGYLGRKLDPTISDDRERMLALSRKEALKEALPITAEELGQCYWFWAKFDTNGDARLSPAERAPMTSLLATEFTQPGQVIFHALLNAPVLGGLPMAMDEFTDSEISTLNGRPELVDAWEQPLAFYRWPTRLVNGYDGSSVNWDQPAMRAMMPNAPTGADLLVDPDDPIQWIPFGIKVRFHDSFGPPSTPRQIDTWHSPLVVSAGPDGDLGITNPEDISAMGGFNRVGLAAVTNEEATFDNITNHNIDGGQ